jgi:hypothetical protein
MMKLLLYIILAKVFAKNPVVSLVGAFCEYGALKKSGLDWEMVG